MVVLVSKVIFINFYNSGNNLNTFTIDNAGNISSAGGAGIMGNVRIGTLNPSYMLDVYTDNST